MKFTPRLAVAVLSLAFVFACKPGAQKNASTGPAADPNAAVAKIGGSTITNKDLEEFAKSELRKLDQQYGEQTYQIKRQAIDNMVQKRLLDDKAKAAGKSPDDYFNAEVASKIVAPTDAEIQALYDQTKASGRQLPPLDQVKDQIVKFLMQQKTQAATKVFYDKLKADAKVEVLLPPYMPPRVDVEAKGQARGPAKAPITIVEFSDYECPYCSRAESVVTEVLAAYPNKIQLFYRDFPLPFHPHAQKAAEAAQCAADQNKYWEMHAKLFASQQALEVPSLKEYAKSLGLDVAKFDKCLDSSDKMKLIQESQKAGEALGINGTPAFYINGIMINGAQPLSAFKSIIDAELAKK